MNVFVLCTGRCASTTFIQACQYITNFSAGHETRAHCIGAERMAYPPDHIEADNRLSWFLGRLDARYGNRAFYVHLTRDRERTAQSFARRYGEGIIGAYRGAILMRCGDEQPIEICRDYVDTVNANIASFLRDKAMVCKVSVELARRDFAYFWCAIGARGNLDAALEEWDVRYNASAA